MTSPRLPFSAPIGFVGEDRPALTDLQNCIHCGFCLPACPTYIATGQELVLQHEPGAPQRQVERLAVWKLDRVSTA